MKRTARILGCVRCFINKNNLHLENNKKYGIIIKENKHYKSMLRTQYYISFERSEKGMKLLWN